MTALAKSKLLGIVLFSIASNCMASGHVAGTYSSLSFNEESGDLSGLEVSLLPVDAGLVASVQIADDGINEVHLATVARLEENLHFSLRLDDGKTVDFTMRCSPASCIGHYRWDKANVDFSLPKTSGYWNRERP